LDMLHMIFPYKACRKSLEALNRAEAKGEDSSKLFSESSQPCLEEQIGECCGLCKAKISKEEYCERVDIIIKFLKGNRKPAIEKLTEEMQKAAADKKFEKAAKLRDALSNIERMEKQIVSDASDEDADIIGIAVINCKALVVIFKQRSGKLIDEQTLMLSGEAENEEQALEQFLPQYYSTTPDIPPMIIITAAAEDRYLPLLEAWLLEQSGHKVELRIPERGKKSQLLILAEKNAHEKMKQMETKWETAAKNTELALEELKCALELPDIPKRIECYDISHFSGTETVGSMVVAKNGKAANDQYRHSTIRTLKEGEVDDYKAIAEVLRRRLKYLSASLKEEESKFKKEGIVFGKARKTEKELINKILKNKEDHKEYLIARKDESPIVIGRIKEHKDKTLELTDIWTDEKIKNNRVLSHLIQKLLHKISKGKVYVTVKKEDEDFYGELGFLFINSLPQVLSKNKGTPMMYAAKDHKEDLSLKSKPDLLVIDGGKGQVSTAVKVLKEMQLQIPVIGLAKREEEIFVPGSSFPIPFEKDSQAKFMLMRMRNEAHRFANRLREKRHEKNMMK
ncbi:UvrB/UvrC motif-containing protein, partial [Patescibacteria group bacterium]|nr:UvrB/UvrC motif-containing protein [Patescibacteria group bacterium]